MPEITRVLIANRGEIAVRVIRTLKEMGIESVAVYTAPDARAAHVFMADHAVLLDSYLDQAQLLAAIKDTGADAVHPGYGLLSENPEFAVKVVEAGAVFVGPPPVAMQAMASKTDARATMVAAGVPVVPGGALSESAQVGFPVLVKASSGGGGKGMRRVDAPEDLEEAAEACSREALKAFGDGHVYLERLVLRPRHVEIQVLADAHGNVVHLFERECSVQRRHQKVVEESPSPAVNPALRAQMGDAAVAAARAVGYVNAGTVEFLLDETGEFYFLEMNTRLQVEHPVTEMVCGVDLVAEQIRVARGEELGYSQADLSQRGHAIECRIYAEDPVSFLPQTGTIDTLVLPEGPGVRHDAAIYPGWEVGVDYDPMLAKLCTWAPTRGAAIDRMRRALDDYVLLGVNTNLPLLRFVLAQPAFRAGDTTTAFLTEHPFEGPGDPPDLAYALRAMLSGAPASAGEAAGGAGTDRFSPWARLPGWRAT